MVQLLHLMMWKLINKQTKEEIKQENVSFPTWKVGMRRNQIKSNNWHFPLLIISHNPNGYTNKKDD